MIYKMCIDDFIFGFLMALLLEYFYTEVKMKTNDYHQYDETEILEIETKIINFYVIGEIVALCVFGITMLVISNFY